SLISHLGFLESPTHSRRITTWPRSCVEPVSMNDDGNQVTALNGTVTVIEMVSPVLAPETSPTTLLTFTVVLAWAVGMLAAVSSLLTALVTSVLDEPGMTPARAPSRAVEVSTLATMTARPNSMAPITRVKRTGAMKAISTAAAPRRDRDRRRCPRGVFPDIG